MHEDVAIRAFDLYRKDLFPCPIIMKDGITATCEYHQLVDGKSIPDCPKCKFVYHLRKMNSGSESVGIKRCGKCGEFTYHNSYFGCEVCPYCGWMEKKCE